MVLTKKRLQNSSKSFLILSCMIGLSYLSIARVHSIEPQETSTTNQALFFINTQFEHWESFPESSTQQILDLITELETNYHFSAEIVRNATKKTIQSKLQDYAQRTYSSDSQLLLFFSSHGYYEPGSTGALIPTDGQREDWAQETWLPYPILENMISRIDCPHILLALDACYSGSFGLQYKGRPGQQPWKQALSCTELKTKALLHQSRLYLTSGDTVRTPVQSQFTDKFLEALRSHNTDGLLGFHGLVDVLLQAEPRPQSGSFRGHRPGGDFVFFQLENCEAFQKSGVSNSTDYQPKGQTNATRPTIKLQSEEESSPVFYGNDIGIFYGNPPDSYDPEGPFPQDTQALQLPNANLEMNSKEKKSPVILSKSARVHYYSIDEISPPPPQKSTNLCQLNSDQDMEKFQQQIIRSLASTSSKSIPDQLLFFENWLLGLECVEKVEKDNSEVAPSQIKLLYLQTPSNPNYPQISLELEINDEQKMVKLLALHY